MRTLGAIALFLIIGAVVQSFKNTPEAIFNRLAEQVDTMQSELPKDMGDGRVMTGVELYDYEVVVTFTFAGLEKGEIDLESFRKFMDTDFVEEVCRNREIKKFQKAEVDITHAYRDKNGELLYEGTVQVAECKN